MLLQREKTPADAFGVQKSTKFTFASNAKSFHIMIDAIYSNKISAPIRELWSNAYDSHRAAGTPDRPFYTKLPNVFDPEFVVRDYGTSMTPDIVENVYTTMFESTKDTSNTEVGMFGLGSKSPFAYTDVFTVETFLNGTHRLYSAYMGDDGCPALDLMAVQKTDEENGVRVSFPVEPDDISRFRLEAVRIAHGFEVLPVTDDNTVFDEITDNTPLLEGPGWKVYAPKYSYPTGEAHVRQGCVVYPIDRSIVSNVTSLGGAVLDLEAMIEMPIGTVAVSPDREKLSYDTQTIANIHERVEEIGIQLKEEVEAQFENIKTFSEAVALRRSLVVRGSGNAMSQLFRDIKWRGKPIPQTISLPYTKRSVRVQQNVMMISWSEMVSGRTWRSKSWQGRFKADLKSFDPTSTRFYFEHVGLDVPRVTHAGLRIKKEMSDFREAADEFVPQTDVAVWVKYKNARELAQFLVWFGRPSADKIVHVNTLPELPQEEKPSSKKRSAPVKCYTLDVDRKAWDEATVDLEKEPRDIVYIATSRDEFVDHGTTVSPSTLTRWVTCMVENGALSSDCVIVKIPATNKKLIERNKDTWMNFFTVAKKFAEDNFCIKGLAYRMQLREMRPSGGDKLPVFLFGTDIALNRTKINRGTALHRFVTMIRWMRRVQTRHHQNETVEMMHASLFPEYDRFEEAQKIQNVIDQDAFMETLENIRHHYPLIERAVPGYAIDIDRGLVAALLSYVEAMDSVSNA